MTNFVVDVEADGPCPGEYSMISIGVIKLDDKLDTTFYSEIFPITNKYIPEALAVSGFSREECLKFPPAPEVLDSLNKWIIKHTDENRRPCFWADNNGFDWMFVNYYFHVFCNENPFGHSSRNINDLYKGLTKNLKNNIKSLRKTKHTHNALDDAKGNAEALLKIDKKYGLGMVKR